MSQPCPFWAIFPRVVGVSAFPIMFSFLSWLQRSLELNLLLDCSCWVGQGFKYIFFTWLFISFSFENLVCVLDCIHLKSFLWSRSGIHWRIVSVGEPSDKRKQIWVTLVKEKIGIDFAFKLLFILFAIIWSVQLILLSSNVGWASGGRFFFITIIWLWKCWRRDNLQFWPCSQPYDSLRFWGHMPSLSFLVWGLRQLSWRPRTAEEVRPEHV